jgi:hypothetical protein
MEKGGTILNQNQLSWSDFLGGDGKSSEAWFELAHYPNAMPLVPQRRVGMI